MTLTNHFLPSIFLAKGRYIPMTPELGHFLLTLALVLASLQMVVPLYGAAKRNPTLMNVGKSTAIASFLCAVGAFACLMHAYITSDFSVLNVTANSHSAKPLLYKISGVWGNHEGSILLWILILSLFGAVVAVTGHKLPRTLQARVLAVQGAIGVGFLLFSLFTSNPFERLFPVPADGQGLNPLLQDPGLAFHPPMLYLGYVGFSMAFSFAIAALLEGKVDAAWGRWVRPWTLAAWSTLTLGIAMGSWWAYYELGWGGWWFWDPVENASLMPWLAGTALLHSAIVVEKRDTMKRWTILLAIITFSLSLLGTFLVRSGVLTSVHAFATDPARGVFILAFLCLIVGGSFLLFWLRAPAMQGGGTFAPISRESSLVFNNFVLAATTGTVLLGTLYPLFLDVVSQEKVSVGPPYFDTVVVPQMLLLALVMGLGPLLAWKRARLQPVAKSALLALILAIILGFFLVKLVFQGPILSALGIAMGVWLLLTSCIGLYQRVRTASGGPLAKLRRLMGLPLSHWGMTIAHMGFGILLISITAVSTWQQETIAKMQPGQSISLAGYDFLFERTSANPGPNYVAVQGQFKVTQDGKDIATLRPESRNYSTPPMQTTEASIYPLVRGDLYAAIGSPDNRGQWGVRLYFKPLIGWMWAGAILIALGGLISLGDRRLRLGLPKEAKPSSGAK